MSRLFLFLFVSGYLEEQTFESNIKSTGKFQKIIQCAITDQNMIFSLVNGKNGKSKYYTNQVFQV